MIHLYKKMRHSPVLVCLAVVTWSNWSCHCPVLCTVSDSSSELMGETVNTQTTTALSGKGNLVFRIIILMLPKKICYKIFLYRSEGPSPDHHLFIGCSQYLSPGKI